MPNHHQFATAFIAAILSCSVASADLTVTADTTYNGTLAPPNNQLTLSPAGNLTVNGLTPSSNPVLWLDQGATASGVQSVYLGDTGKGSLHITNGSNFSNGSAYGTTVGYNVGSQGTLLVGGPNASYTSTAIVVGLAGTGTMRVESGGLVTTYSASLGLSGQGNGSATIYGTDGRWTSSNGVTVGQGGNGTLRVENGGTLSTGGLSRIGQDTNSVGATTVTGSGAVWNGGTGTAGTNGLYVGQYGNGTLNVSHGGVVNGMSVEIGVRAGSTGRVDVVNANSRLLGSSIGSLFVGREGNGSLYVQDGGFVSTPQALILGWETGSSGNAASFFNGQIESGYNLIVGGHGSAQLTVSSGGRVTALWDAYVAAQTGSTGGLTVSGADATLTVARSLYISSFGTWSSDPGGAGTLSINNGGAVSVANDLKIAAQGSVNIDSVSSLTVSGNILVNGGKLNSNAAIAAPMTVMAGGLVTGTGPFTNLTVGSGGQVSPGNSPGTLTSSATAWNTGGKYVWEINKLDDGIGAAEQGSNPGWDAWHTGTLTLGGPFTVELKSLTLANNAGALSGWSNAAEQTWQIATTNNGAFTSVAALTVNSQPFQQYNSLGGGGFSLESADGGNALQLRFTPAVVITESTLDNTTTSLQGNSISAGSNSRLTLGANSQVTGFGSISPPGNSQTITNQGEITANLPGQTLSISSNTFVNQGGTVQATNGGLLNIDAQSYVQTNGVTNLGVGGTVTSPTFEIQGGTLSGSGTIDTSLTNNGTIAPGNSPGAMNITGDLTLGQTSNLSFEIGNLIQGTQYDFINVEGHAALDGLLSISFIDGFESTISGADTFTILSSGTLSGAFDNVASGSWLYTPYGSFLVSYGGSDVVLSNFTALPEPSTLILAAFGITALGLTGRRYRRRRIPA